MANEALSAACATNRDVVNLPPGPFQDCSDVIHISVFFDGTGNNKDADESEKKWSNVARMWLSTTLRRKATEYPIYIAGVGTKFNGQSSWYEKGNVWLEDSLLGSGAGRGGDRRLDMGSDNVNDRLRQVLVRNAQRLGGEVAAYAKANQAKSFGELNEKLGRHRLIKIINVSVFGFSRGAALARAFVNRLVGECQRVGDELQYQGYPLRVNFLGLFDTVASFGLPARNVRLPWDERELIVPHEVERCTHYVAAHELRYAFPVDLISRDGQIDARWVETLYPGVHSDVGGGYEPISQGISNNYARIPMRDMMADAAIHGVRVLSYRNLQAPAFAALFRERYECLPNTEAAYVAYHAVAPQGGDLRSQRLAHMKLLYSAYGSLHRRGQRNATQRQKAESKVKRMFGPFEMAQEIELHRLLKADERLRRSSVGNDLAQYVKAQEWQINAWDAEAPEGVLKFVSEFVHDSKVDFLANIEPFSYFRLRTMQESTRSVWNETGDWIADQASAAGDAARRTAVRAQQTAEQAAAAAKTKALEAKETARRAYERAKFMADEAYDATKHKSREAYEAGKRQAQEAYERARELADRAEREALAAGKAGRRMVEQGVEWVEYQLQKAAAAFR